MKKLKIKVLFEKFLKAGYSTDQLAYKLSISKERLKEIRKYSDVDKKTDEVPEYADMMIFYYEKVK